ncbi:hypothetical protein NT6N_21200 [Oceaniferula spumae]|uniref:Ice-binding protein C-terminal domain-containing protein n=1 Tax=Oceaniferula spumae TaxID=2979115 RepID=A0AAT9FM81_9BACT
MKHILLTSTLLAGSFVSAQAAAVVLDDWALSQGAATLTNANTDSPTVGDGTADNADATGVYANFGAAVTLANVGDKLTFSGTVDLVGITANNGGGFRFAIFNGPHDAATSYFVFAGTTSGPSRLYERTTAGTFVSNSGIASFQSSAANAGSVDSGVYTFAISLERTAGGVQVDTLMNQGATEYATISYEDTTPLTTFSGVGFLGTGNLNADQMAFSGVTVDFSPVPEPSSTSLLGLGGLALILRRRR